jgi:hypothetical protein
MASVTSCVLTLAQNRLSLHSFLDKDLNTVYLVMWNFFAWP